MSKNIDKIISKNSIEVNIVTNNLFSVDGVEKINPLMALVMGFCHVLPLEYPNILCRNIDLSLNGVDDINDSVEELLKIELNSKIKNVIVAIRNKYRWIQYFENYPINKFHSKNLLNNDACYVVTGGLGVLVINFQNI